MRLHRITLTDYRGVRNRTVEFADSGVTIVAGPNEIGKTSLVEALDLLVEEKSSAVKKEIKAAQPVGRDVGPSVEAELSFGGYRVVYRKRWLRGHLTELRVLSPRQEQLSGESAHERFAALLHEAGIDLFLWRQLRISQDWQRVRGAEQRTDGQPSIAGRAAVSGALQERSAQAVRTGPEEALFERARQEYDLYYTPKRGEPRGEYAQARTALDEANRRVEAAKQTLADAEGAVSEQTRLRRELHEAAAELAETRADLAALEEQNTELAQVRERLRTAEAALALAGQVEAATADLERLAERAFDLDTDIAAKRQDLVAAQTVRDQARQKVTQAQAESERLRAAVRLAGEDVRRHRDRQAADRLAAQLDRAQDAVDRIRAADMLLAANCVTEDVLDGIEAAHKQWDKASALLHANAATVDVQRLGDAELTIENGSVGLSGSTASFAAVEAITVVAPGVVRVTVTPGAGERQRREKERTTRENYRELCAAADVPDLAAAKDAQRRRRESKEERRAAVQERDAAVADVAQDGEELSDLHEQLRALRGRIAAHDSGRPAEPPAPATLEAAQTAETDLRDALEAAEASLRLATTEAAHDEERVVQLNTSIVLLQRAVDDAAADTGHAKNRLKELPAARTESELIALRAEQQQAAARIDQLNPDRLQLRLDNVRPLPAHLEEQQVERRERLATLAERIATLSDSGPEESLDDALAHQARVQRTYEQMHRDATAAKLLYETLDRYRSRAWLRYAEPFRALVEKYAALVFGAGTTIEVSEDLTISKKTSAGSTVAFDQLSAGAREQLALLGRIACAELITPPGAQDVGGVPLILDDALGHTDRGRLDQLAAILDRAGSRVQIILLTHAPERFRIGTAHRQNL